MDIGERLRALRSAHGLSIRALAERAKVSTSVISEVERGKTEPSISTLKHLATALGTSLTYFFNSSSQQNGHVIRAQERKDIGDLRPADGSHRPSFDARGVHYELGSPDASDQLEVIYGRYESGATTGADPYTHEGEEWAMVLHGRFKVVLGDEVHFLDPGDSIWFRSHVPHRIENVADGESEYIWVNTPKSF